MEELLLRAYLHLLAHPQFGSKLLSALLARFGNLQEIASQQAQVFDELGLPELQRDILFSALDDRNRSSELIDRALAWHNNVDQQLVTFESSHYPYLLKTIAVPPPLLFCHGKASLLSEPMCAFVGSRNATSYGKRQATLLAAELADLGFTIVSGLARGIDAASHSGARKAQGNTIGVIGTGIDIIYPRSNAKLFDDLKHNGLVLTEFLFGAPPRASHFPQRNRIISGVSLGTVVVEASLRSGSLITARLALEQNRNVFALPGPVDSEMSSGCHFLLRDGATLVQKPQDICDELLSSWNLVKPKTKSKTKTKNAIQPSAQNTKQSGITYSLTNSESEVLVAISEPAMLFDNLAHAVSLQQEALIGILLQLELKGLIQNDGGRISRT